MQKRANRADQSVLFFLAGANFWEKHAKNRRKHAKIGENTQKQAKNRRFFGANFFGEKLVGANFYAFCNYVHSVTVPLFVFLPIYLISDLYISDLSSKTVLKRKELLRDEQACLVRITNQYIFIHLISNIKIIT